MSEWFTKAFDAAYLEVYDQFEWPDVWQQDCGFLREQLGLEKGQEVLDLCCGSGRHSAELARRGLKVTGLDISSAMLEFADKRALNMGVEVRLLNQDARDMELAEEFDAAFCYLTSFGYCDDEGDRRILENVFRSLKPGGRFLLEQINMLWLLGSFTETEQRNVRDEYRYVEKRTYDPRTGRILTQREKQFVDRPPVKMEPFSVRGYFPHEIIKCLEDAGFEVGDLVAAPSGESFMPFSTKRLAVVAKRPE